VSGASGSVKIYGRETVLEAARARIAWLFDEFQHVRVNISGGKDSTVLVHLALEVAREKGRLPLTVQFIDQEAEWEATIDTIRETMTRPDVTPRWYQMPMRLFNATSSTEHWLQCWDPAVEHLWMRPREPYAITENLYGTDRFGELFAAILAVEHPHETAAGLSGVRVEESPGRAVGLTVAATYKGQTWGKKQDTLRGHYAFYPLYDWTTPDIWKAIHEHGWPYNRIYDHQWQWGLHPHQMRVSNVHHETSLFSLFYMQETEPQTWERLTARLGGIDTAAKMGAADYFPKRLPFMFGSWREYRDFLLEKLIADPTWRAGFEERFARQDALYTPLLGDKVHRMHVKSILTNDWEGIKLDNFERTKECVQIRLRRAGENPW
jgi:predicted phosphoadenosine phosphosulfate sulfurtransferase